MKTGTDVIVAALKRHPMTAGQMLALGVSVCPWRRAAEWLDSKAAWEAGCGGLIQVWELRKGTVTRGGQVLTTWRIVRAR